MTEELSTQGAIERVERDSDRDYYMSADESKKYGLVDEVVETLKDVPKGGGDMAPLADHLLAVPSATTARLQEMHILLGQMLCAALEVELGLVTE